MKSYPPLPPLIALVGPTAVGKSTLAVALGRRFDGEIICADSRSLYRGMDIGTAKPTRAQRAAVPHHLLDMLDPDQPFSLAVFQQLAYTTMADIAARGRVPFLVGGSGLYVKAILEGFAIPELAPDIELRRRLEQEAQAGGAERLYAELEQVDPVAARHIQSGNVRRVIRALEVYRLTGVPISKLQARRPPPYRILTLGLTRPRPGLDELIAQRVQAMFAAGLVAEVQRLVRAGYGWELPSMSGIGYREVGMYLRGEVDLETARNLLVRNTRRFVRRQYQWFRLSDPAICWLDADEPGYEDSAARTVGEFVAMGRPGEERRP